MRRLLVALLVVVVLAWLLLPGGGPHVESGSVLVLDVEGRYVESVEAPLLARLTGPPRRPFVGLLSELRKAERDERLAGVVLRIRNLDIGWGKAQELRDAIGALRRAGRRTIAYFAVESFGANLEYYVASAAEEVHVAPGVTTPLVGLAAEYVFLGGLWEKLGVEFEVESIGRYKSAPETLAGREMSDAHREVANALLDSVDEQFVQGIAEGRGLAPDFVRRGIASGPSSAEALQALGLVDRISFLDEVVEMLGGGPVLRGAEYAQVPASSVGFDPVARFALVYGSGSVVAGEGGSTPSGEPRLAAEEVSRALHEAAEDDSVRAIVFRIDSPGGSPPASDVVWRATQEVKGAGKPLVASFSDIAASGGYYAACGADAIYGNPGTLTGSIGVFVMRPVVRDLLDKLGIGVESFTRGPYADVLLASRPLSPESREWLRSEVTAIYELFVERVAEGRSLSQEQVDAVGQGRVWTGAQALETGLVDELGGLRAAVDRAKREVGLDADADVELVVYPAPRSLAQQIDDVLRRVSVAIEPPEPLAHWARRLEPWWSATPGAPLLLPPFDVEIR